MYYFQISNIEWHPTTIWCKKRKVCGEDLWLCDTKPDEKCYKPCRIHNPQACDRDDGDIYANDEIDDVSELEDFFDDDEVWISDEDFEWWVPAYQGCQNKTEAKCQKDQAFATAVITEELKSTKKRSQSCTYCGPDTKHVVLDCRKFKALQPAEKSEVCKSKGLCYKTGHTKKRN